MRATRARATPVDLYLQHAAEAKVAREAARRDRDDAAFVAYDRAYTAHVTAARTHRMVGRNSAQGDQLRRLAGAYENQRNREVVEHPAYRGDHDAGRVPAVGGRRVRRGGPVRRGPRGAPPRPR